MRRDLTRSHRMTARSSSERVTFFQNHRSVCSGTLIQCLTAQCCQHLSENEKSDIVPLIIAVFAASADRDFESLLGNSMIEQQHFKVPISLDVHTLDNDSIQAYHVARFLP